MVGRCLIRLSIAVIALGYALSLSAGEIGDFLSSFPRDFKRRNAWPEPFVFADRVTVHQAMASQVAAGWERQNLLSDFHFLPGGKDLTEDGRMRVQWIMTEVPEMHRQIYVHRANTPQETAVRMQTVQRLVTQSAYPISVPVLESTRTDDGWPADHIDTVIRKAEKGAMDPKLMGSSSTGGSGGGH